MTLLLHLMYTGCFFHMGYRHKDRPAGAFHEQFQKVLSLSKENILPELLQKGDHKPYRMLPNTCFIYVLL